MELIDADIGVDTNEVILKEGTKLYHGSGEPFDDPLRVGGYDEVLWTARDQRIAKSYIPTSGSAILVTPKCLMRPIRSTPHQKLQNDIGIPFDYTKVEWESYGDRARSYTVPQWMYSIPLDQLPTTGSQAYRVSEEVIAQRIINYLEGVLGYEPYQKAYHVTDVVYKLKVDDSYTVMPNDWHMPGRLFTLTANVPIRIYDMRVGSEPDQTDLQYHQIDRMHRLRDAGYDGVIIWDFAQVSTGSETNNYPHSSIGIFEGSVHKFDITYEEAEHPRDWADYMVNPSIDR